MFSQATYFTLYTLSSYQSLTPQSCFPPMPSKARCGLSSLHLVCQQVLKVQLSCKVACLSIPQGENTHKNLLHILHTVLNKGQREACSWSKVELSLRGLYRGIPHCILLRWHVGESTPLSEWFINGYRPRCGSVDAGSLKGGRRLCIKGRSWKVQHQGRLTIFTSIAPCGRHFKDTSSLKTWARTFMCCRIYSLHYLHFMWFSYLQQSGRPHSSAKQYWFTRDVRYVLHIILKFCLVAAGLFCWGVLLTDCFLFRYGSRIAEPSGGRGSVLARCSRSGHTSLLHTSCPYWLGLRTMHR